MDNSVILIQGYCIKGCGHGIMAKNNVLKELIEYLKGKGISCEFKLETYKNEEGSDFNLYYNSNLLGSSNNNSEAYYSYLDNGENKQELFEGVYQRLLQLK